MKKITLLVLAVLAVCACSQKEPDPVADAIVAEMMKDIDQPYKIVVEELQLLGIPAPDRHLRHPARPEYGPHGEVHP